MPSVDLPLGTIDYRVFGPHDPDAPTAVFVHGFLVNGTLWDGVAERLAVSGVRCIVPDWPLGSHRTPIPDGRDLSPIAISAAVLDLLQALDLRDVVLVGNDSGGAICQLALAGDTTRIGGLVLTNCDGFETFPPRFFVPLFVLARFRLAVRTLAQSTRLRGVRHSPLAYGQLLLRPRSAALTRGWVDSVVVNPAIRRDINRFARGVQRTELVDSASWLSRFHKPVRLVWGAKDRHFTVELGRRIAAALPQATMTEVPGATTFVPVDRPELVADAIAELVLQPGAGPTAPHSGLEYRA